MRGGRTLNEGCTPSSISKAPWTQTLLCPDSQALFGLSLYLYLLNTQNACKLHLFSEHFKQEENLERFKQREQFKHYPVFEKKLAH